MSQADPLPWDRIKGILAGALERAAGDRPAFLATACGDDARLRQEVESLLAAHAAAEASQFIETPPEFRDPAGLEGHVVGPYKVLGEIGRGGMGAVYRAVRADDVYQKRVALKVVGRRDPDLIQRFREERQILAGLDHPGIARLIDGGATAEGLPWLAMDFVEGQPITDYVKEHALSLRARLELFREACKAVHYAHQNLVVHRDLKPSNILVTPAGAPRLLDFGIAKLLSVEARATTATLTMMRPMTPAYASPEQVGGKAVTTASDVYSLGVLLCEILTGRRPHEFTTGDPAEAARVIATVPPLAPSVLAAKGPSPISARALEGDLDNIVLMALRKEPERRYASVDQLSEDVRLYLERRPVIARPDTLRYRTARFVGRNRGLVATALALGLSLVVALGVALAQARQARRERAKAEQRFEDVRELAHSFLYEFHDSIENLPGSTAARQLLVDRGLHYLDRLSGEGGTPALQREVANGYVRVGDVQGRPNFANLGDVKGARVSYAKAVTGLRALDAAHPGDPQVRGDLAKALHHSAGLLEHTFHDFRGAVDAEREALALSEAVVAAAPDDIEARRVLLGINVKLGDVLMATGKMEESLAVYQEARPRYEALFERTRNPRDLFSQAVALGKVGGVQKRLGRGAEALATLGQGRDILRSLAAGGKDLRSQRALAVILNYRGDTQADAGDDASAEASYREALALREALAPADPHNALARADLEGSYLRIGDVRARDHDDVGAAREYQRALAITMAVEAKDKGDDAAAADRAAVEARMAEIEARGGQTRAALARYEMAIPRLEAVLGLFPEDVDGRYDLAVALASQARSQAALGAATGSRDAWERARASYAKSLDLWRSIRGHKTGDSRLEAGPPAPNLRAAEAGLARCDASLAPTASAGSPPRPR